MLRELFQIVEIDMDRCTRVFGVGSCTAALSSSVAHKCFNTFGTCAVKPAFISAPFTLRFCENSPSMPKGQGLFPFLKSVSQITATVNIAGSDDKMGPLGRTATVSVTLQNAPFHDRGLDPYQAERVSGAAQFGGAGYDPGARGTFFGKLRARWPHYTGRPLRVLEGYIEAGAFVVERTRHFTLTDWVGPDDKGVITLKAKDPLSALADDKAVIPEASKGVLTTDIDAVSLGPLTLQPVGAGAAYPASGRACIGAELVNYTRAGDVVTLTGRGVRRSSAASHAAGDTFQEVLAVENMRIDDFAELLARKKLPAALVPKATKWKPEVDRWASSVRLDTDILPTGIAKLLGELAVLGVSIFWDDVAQEMALRVNRPPDLDQVYELSDLGQLTAASVQDRNEDRLTELYFYSVQRDPTKTATSADNFDRLAAIADSDAMDARAYGDSHIRKVFCRFFNRGADPVIRMLGRRLLSRFNTAPIRLRATVSVKDRNIPLAAVVRVASDVFEDATGQSAPRLMQVISREPTGEAGEVEYILQAFQFGGRYGFATENARPSYTASTDEQRARGMYACNPVTLKMSNGDEPYRAI